MSAIVGGDDVQSGRQAETYSANERIREARTGQVDSRELANERADLILRAGERPRRFTEGRRRPRLDLRGRSTLSAHGRLHPSDERAPGESWPRWPPPSAARGSCPLRGRPHCGNVHCIGRGQVIETLRDAPRARVGTRRPGGFVESLDERPGIGIRRIELFEERREVRRLVGVHRR